MTPEETGFLEWAFKGTVGAVLTLGARLWFILFSRVRENEKEIAAHKLNVSDNYVKKSDLQEIKLSLTEVRQDIKILLTRGTEK